MTNTKGWLLWTLLAIAGCATLDASQTPSTDEQAPKTKVAEKKADEKKAPEEKVAEKKGTEKKVAEQKKPETTDPKKTDGQTTQPVTKKPGEVVVKKPENPENVVPPIRCKSAQEVVDIVLAAVAKGDWRTLNALRVDGKEYEEVLWPRFVAERQELQKQKASFHFFLLETKSRAGIQDVLSEFGRKKLEFVAFDKERVEDYQTFKLWRNVFIDFKVNGKLTRERLFGAIIERDGKFYLLSYPS